MHVLLFALALSVQQAPQTPTAQSSAPEAPNAAAAQTQAPAEDPEERVVCRREHVVGSNRRQQICMTVRERAQLRDESRREAERSGRRNHQQIPEIHTPSAGL